MINLPELRAKAERAKEARDKSNAFMLDAKTWNFEKHKESDALIALADAAQRELVAALSPDMALRMIAVCEVATLADRARTTPGAEAMIAYCAAMDQLRKALAGLRGAP